jgi:hypothetical protein
MLALKASFFIRRVAEWRVEQLAKRGLDGVDADSRFVLSCASADTRKGLRLDLHRL